MTGPTQTSPPSGSTEMRDASQSEQYAQRAAELTGGADAYALDTLAEAPAGQPTAWVRGLLEAKLTHSQEAAKGVRR